MSFKNKIMKYIANPAKIANTLDWKKMNGGSIVTLDIGHKSIGIAIASHPGIDTSFKQLKTLDMKLETKILDNSKIKFNQKRVLSSELLNELQSIVRDNDVCGFVINWPLQKEGRVGASCGRVLHALESIVDADISEDARPFSSVLTKNRLFCLWDGEHVTIPRADKWGRCPVYGVNYQRKTDHIASIEQYAHESSRTTVANIWDDFCKSHWPEIYKQKQKGDNIEEEWLDDFEDTRYSTNASAV